MGRCVRKLLIVLVSMTALSTGGALFATVDDFEDGPEAGVVIQNNGIAEINFDQWVFQGVGSAAAGRDRFKTQLKLRIDELDRICELTEEQKQKLMLAARGDVKQYFDQVEQTRAKFQKVRREPNAMNEIWQDIQPLQAKLVSGIFKEGSLYSKTIRTTLTPEQVAKFQSDDGDRRRYKYEAAVAVAIASLERSVALRHAQRRALFEILIQETRPPANFGINDSTYVLFQISQLPEDRVKKLLDGNQRKAFDAVVAQIAGAEHVLLQQGLITKEELNRLKQANKPPADATKPNHLQKQKINAALDALNNAPADATRPEQPTE